MITARKWIASLTVATVVSLTAVATASAADNAPTKTVKAWDLDLAKRSDVQALYDRVHTAATAVCRTEAQENYRHTRLRAPFGWQQRCVQDAVDSAIRHAGNPALAALHTQAPRVAAR